MRSGKDELVTKISLLTGDGGLESRQKSQAMIMCIETVVEPLEQAVSVLTGQVAQLDRKLGRILRVIVAMAGGIGTIFGVVLTTGLQNLTNRATDTFVDRSLINSAPPDVNCSDLAALGLSSIRVQYLPEFAHLDRDADGVACE